MSTMKCSGNCHMIVGSVNYCHEQENFPWVKRQVYCIWALQILPLVHVNVNGEKRHSLLQQPNCFSGWHCSLAFADICTAFVLQLSGLSKLPCAAVQITRVSGIVTQKSKKNKMTLMTLVQSYSCAIEDFPVECG